MKIYNFKQRQLFMKTFGCDPHQFTEHGIICAMSKRWVMDIVKFDDYLATQDSEYNSDECMYKDHKDVSCNDYIRLKFGDNILRLVKDLMDGNFIPTDYTTVTKD